MSDHITNPNASFELSDREFNNIKDLIYSEVGISLPDTKKPMILSRLSKRLRALNLDSFTNYYKYLQDGDQDGMEMIHMLDQVSTNTTSFFREAEHFEFFGNQVIPQLQSDKRIRMWCAASSSGEEPYTIGMTLREYIQDLDSWDCRMLASDISTQVLEKASDGVYDEGRISKLPKSLLKKYFYRSKGDSPYNYKAKPSIRDFITYKRINLMDDSFPIKNPLDVIFCRNVMIYFDKETMATLVDKFYQILKPGGYLFIGMSESLQWVNNDLEYIQPSVYRKPL